MSWLSPRWHKVLRDLWSHKLRTLLVVASIAVGVFAVAVVLGGRAVLLASFETSYEGSQPAHASLRTREFGDEILRSARAAPYVRYADARRVFGVRFTQDSKPTSSSAGWKPLGLSALSDFDSMRVRKFTREEGTQFQPGPGEIVIERSAEQVADFKVGDYITVETADGTRKRLLISAIAHDINAFPAMFVGEVTGYVSMDALPELKEPEEYNQLLAVFEGKNLSRAQASRYAARLRDDVVEPAGVQVLNVDVPKPGSHFLGDIFKAVSLLLLALGVLSLGLSAFLVVNTVSALMAQQVRQVGIMKAIGARASQLEWLYVVTVSVYGVLAILIGLPAAAAASRWFTDFAADILNFSVTSYAPPSWVIAVEIIVGLFVPLAAAAAPVRRGSRMSVVRALNSTGMAEASFGHGLADRVLGSIRGLPRPVALSLRNTFLRKGRLVLTLSTLALASAVVLSVFSVQASIEQTIADLESWWNYDVQLVFASPQSASAVEDETLGVEGVEAVETWLDYSATVIRSDGTQNESFGIVGLDPATDFVEPRLVEGRWLEPGDTDAVVINTDALNEEPSLSVGSDVTLSVRGEEAVWQVVGVIQGQLGGPTLFCDGDELAGVLGDAGVTRLLVRGAADDAKSQQALLDAVEMQLTDAGFPVAGGRTQAGLSEQLREQLGILIAFLVIMAAILALVGVIGLTGTMSINVLESTREIGVMRATGAQHQAIYQIFVTEGVAVGAIAWVIGSVLAYPMSLGLVRILAEAIGIPLTYSFSWPGVGAWLVLMLVISGLASIAPAFRASQVSVRDAIAYE